MKLTEIKQRYRIFFRNVSLVRFTAELQSMSKMIHNRCTCKLIIIKTLRLHTCMQMNNYVLFFVLIRYSLLFSSEIILKQLFASGSVNIVKYKEPLDQSDCWKLFVQLWNYTNLGYSPVLVEEYSVT